MFVTFARLSTRTMRLSLKQILRALPVALAVTVAAPLALPTQAQARFQS